MSSIDEAFHLYEKHILDEEKISLLKAYNLKVTGSVPSVLWELFGALLTGKSGTGATGADLAGWEIKSAKMGGSFEYQYHLNTGASKLEEDLKVNHLFCSYSDTYTDVTVRVMKGANLAQYFNKWKPEYQKNYDSKIPSGQRRQRFRRAIPAGYVKSNGVLVISIENGKLIERNDLIINQLNELLK